MANERITFSVLVLFLAVAWCKPIMVTFGTNQGPIVPPEPSPPPPAPRVLRDPAPVSEESDDIPNPSTYRPLLPHQYRTRLYAYKPPTNLIFGTPLDQSYTPSIDKYNLFKKQQTQSVGVGYTGPHVFERQEYEIYEAKKLKLQPSVNYQKVLDAVRPKEETSRQEVNDNSNSNNNNNPSQNNDNANKVVPQIGVIYSAGVRYYVPQVVYYQEDQENSVYDQSDEKYYHRDQNQQ